MFKVDNCYSYRGVLVDFVCLPGVCGGGGEGLGYHTLRTRVTFFCSEF